MAHYLYYLGDTINFAFKIESRLSVKIGATEPFSVDTGANPSTGLVKIHVSVYSNEGEIVHEDPVTVIDNIVKYTLNPEMTKHSGDYAAFFEMTFEGGQKKTYKHPFVVLPRTPAESGKERAAKLNKDTSEREVDEAVGQDLRSKRKAGGDHKEGIKEVYELAQHKTGKRLEK